MKILHMKKYMPNVYEIPFNEVRYSRVTSARISSLFGFCLFFIMPVVNAKCDFKFTPADLNLGTLRGGVSTQQQNVAVALDIMCTQPKVSGFWLSIPSEFDGLSIDNLLSPTGLVPYRLTLGNGTTYYYQANHDVFISSGQRVYIEPQNISTEQFNMTLHLHLRITPNVKHEHLADRHHFSYNLDIYTN